MQALLSSGRKRFLFSRLHSEGVKKIDQVNTTSKLLA
jgi:hypothetical protein